MHFETALASTTSHNWSLYGSGSLATIPATQLLRILYRPRAAALAILLDVACKYTAPPRRAYTSRDAFVDFGRSGRNSTDDLGEIEVCMGTVEKVFSDVLDLHINRSVSLSAFHCTFFFLQQSSYRIFIAKSLLSSVSVNPYGGLK